MKEIDKQVEAIWRNLNDRSGVHLDSFDDDIQEDIKSVFKKALEQRDLLWIKSLEDNRKETLYDSEDANEIMNDSIDNFIEAVKSEMSSDKEED